MALVDLNNFPNVCPVQGYPGYFVSCTGFVFSTRTRRGKIRCDNKARVLSQEKCNNGYRRVSLSIDGFVTRLTFIGPCQDGMEATHKDGNRANNSLSNLSWKTHKDNEKDKIRHATLKYGEHHPQSKVSDAVAKRIIKLFANRKGKRFRNPGKRQSDIAKEIGVSRTTVTKIARGKSRKHLYICPN